MRRFMLFCLQVGLGLGGVGCAPAASPGGGGGSSEGSGGAGSSSGGLGNSETGVGTGEMPTGTGGGDSTAGVGTGGTGEGGTSGTSETGASSSMDCQFICETTGFGPECDKFLQDCPEGQKCAAWAEGGGGSYNAVKCVPVMGDKQPGEECFAPEGGTSGLDDCAEGVMCWNVDENNMGVCVALCSGNPEAPVCPDDGPCTLDGNGALNLCFTNCDPLVQDCVGDDLCIPNGEGFTCVLDGSGDEGQVNDICEFANACDKGLVCLDPVVASSACDPRAFGCCQPFCEFPGGGCPNPDQACVQWYDPVELPPDSPKLKYGICKISG